MVVVAYGAPETACDDVTVARQVHETLAQKEILPRERQRPALVETRSQRAAR